MFGFSFAGYALLSMISSWIGVKITEHIDYMYLFVASTIYSITATLILTLFLNKYLCILIMITIGQLYLLIPNISSIVNNLIEDEYRSTFNAIQVGLGYGLTALLAVPIGILIHYGMINISYYIILFIITISSLWILPVLNRLHPHLNIENKPTPTTVP